MNKLTPEINRILHTLAERKGVVFKRLYKNDQVWIAEDDSCYLCGENLLPFDEALDFEHAMFHLKDTGLLEFS